MNSVRIFFLGGLTSYRAMFTWISPWVLVPSFMIAPVVQILLFVYIGRATGIASDQFFVIGNALQYSAIPCLFAMAMTVSGERAQRTLSVIMMTPARRLPLILGRSLPVVANGFVVSLFALVVGDIVVGTGISSAAFGSIAFAVAVASFSCTGLGLVNAAVGLRVRNSAVLSNVLVGLLLVFCGANIPLVDMPAWMAAIGRLLPLTHGIEAARSLAGDGSLPQVAPLLLNEAAVGLAYGAAGLAVLHYFERASRRSASLETA
jgi:ABC-2 type transport system permease protein